MELFQWFFMVLSVRPSKTLAISAHLLLCFRCIKNKIHSSSLDQFIFFMRGFRWLCQRSLHCLPIRPARCSAIVVHLYGPCCSTSWSTRQSSSSVQGPFIKVTLWFLPEVFYKLLLKDYNCTLQAFFNFEFWTSSELKSSLSSLSSDFLNTRSTSSSYLSIYFEVFVAYLRV